MPNFAPVVTAVRECISGVIGAVRTMSGVDIAEGGYSTTTDTAANRALARPRWEVSVVRASVHKQSPWEHYPKRLIELELEVRTEWTTQHELLDDERANLRIAILDVLERMRAALMRADNLSLTSASVSTGIVSGCLHECLGHELESEDWPKRLVVWTSRYRTVVVVDQTPG